MMDLTEKLGLTAIFEPETLEMIYGAEVDLLELVEWHKTLTQIWKSLKFAYEFTDEKGNVIKEPDFKKYYNPEGILCCGQRNVHLDKKDLAVLLKKNNIRPDVTILPQGTIYGEYIRTEGHEHPSGKPEIYEVIYGKISYLLFKPVEKDSENIEDMMFVSAEEGDHVLFPPCYQHISVNIGNSACVMTDYVNATEKPDFDYIKRHNGAPYWVMKGENGNHNFIPNPRYKEVLKIRKVKPAEEVELSHGIKIKKSEPMFNLVRDGKIHALDFLNNPSDNEIYKKAFYNY